MVRLMPRRRETLDDVNAAIAAVDAKIGAMYPPRRSRWLDLLDDGFTSADALDICAREARARPPVDQKELGRLRKLKDKLWRKRQRMTA